MSAALTKANIVTAAEMPRPRMNTAAQVNPGLRRNWRKPWRTSCIKFSSQVHPHMSPTPLYQNQIIPEAPLDGVVGFLRRKTAFDLFLLAQLAMQAHFFFQI